MIDIRLSIHSPWLKSSFMPLYNKFGTTPFKHKFWEIDVTRDDELLLCGLEYTTRKDHAGLRLAFALFGYKCILQFYDHRHWDYENNCWEKTV